MRGLSLLERAAGILILSTALALTGGERSDFIDFKFLVLNGLVVAGGIAWLAAGSPWHLWTGIPHARALAFVVFAVLLSVWRALPEGGVKAQDALIGLTRFIGLQGALLAGFLAGKKLRLRRLVAVLASAGLAVVSAEGILEGWGHGILPWGQDERGVPVLWSTMGNPNVVAGFIVGALPIAVWLAASRGPLGARVLGASAGAGGLVCLAMTRCRGGYLALVASGIAALVLGVRSGGRKRRMWIKGCGIGIAAGVVLVAGFVILNPGERVRVAGKASCFLSSESVKGRLLLWKAALMMVREAPVLGSGPGAFWRLSPGVRAAMGNAELLRGQRAWHVHNDYLEMAAELGILTLVSFLWLVVGYAVAVRRAMTGGRAGDSSEHQKRLFCIGAAASLVGTLAHAFVGFDLESPASAALFWALLGLVGGMLGTVAVDRHAVRFTAGSRRALSGSMVAVAAVLAVLYGFFPFLGAWYVKRSFVLAARARWKDAGRLLVRADRYLPNSPVVERGLGVAAVARGSFMDARGHFERALELDPYDPEARENLAVLLMQMNDAR